MARVLQSRLLLRHISARPFCSSAMAAKEPIASAEPLLKDAPEAATGSKRSWGLLKFGIFSALVGAVGATSYASYAYNLEELDEQTRILKSFANKAAADDASTMEKFRVLLSSTAIKVPVKALEVYLDIRKSIVEQVRGFTEPSSDKLLPELHPQEAHVFTLVLDLNETLVFSDWTRERGWRTFKRPGVEAFLEHLAQFYEIVVYSDQLSMYVDPVVDRLDQKGCIRYRLSRAATRYVDGKHYRDLAKLNRDPSRILYVSGHAVESSLQRENCVPVKPWKLEADDTALVDLIPFLEYVARNRPADIRPVLASYEGHDIASEFIERSKEYQRRMREQKQQGRFWRR